MKTSYKGYFLLIVLMNLFFSLDVYAQQADHLYMSINMKDSVATVKATYSTRIKKKTDSTLFLLNPGFQIDSITAKGLESYSMAKKEGRPIPFWLLKFSDTLEANQELSVEFNYKINLSKQNHMRSDWIELNADKFWFPNLNDLNNKFTYEISIDNFPESYTIVTHTDAVMSRKGDRITIKKDVPWFEVLVLAGKNLKEWKYDKDITVIGNKKIPDTLISSLGEKVRNSINLMNNSFGVSKPIRSFYVLLRNTNRDELGFQFNRRNLIITGTDFNDYGNLSHEIAHFWWTEANFIEEPWMNESFANYSMYKVLKTYDEENYDKLLTRTSEKVKTAIPVMRASLFATDSYDSYYHKGALLLLELEDKIGSEAMQNLLRTIIANGIKTTNGFLEELQRQTNRDHRGAFEKLLNQ